MYTFLNTDFVEDEKAVLHVSDLAIQRGYGIFDFLRVMENHPMFLDDHLNRFYASAREMRLEVEYTPEEFKSILLELITKNNLPMSGIKITLTSGYSPDGYQLIKPNLIITQQSLNLSVNSIQKGIKVITHEYVREMPHVKTINYLMGVWTQKKMMEQQASDVLYQINGEVSEFPRCNFFLVKKDGTLVTPGKNILSGITRKHVLELSSKKFNSMEGTITLSDITDAREAFLTSTTKRIIPITQVDAHQIGDGTPGPVAIELYGDLVQLEESELRTAGIKNKAI